MGVASVIGGCVKLPEGTQLRRVVGVAGNDQLNLRNRPNASGKTVGGAYAKGFVWLKSAPQKNGWVRVAGISRPNGERGLITAVEGWVKAKFLGAASTFAKTGRKSFS